MLSVKSFCIALLRAEQSLAVISEGEANARVAIPVVFEVLLKMNDD